MSVETISPIWLLTPKERKIIRLIADGLMNKEIAGEMGLAYETAKNHVTAIYRKLNVSNRVEASKVYWQEIGL